MNTTDTIPEASPATDYINNTFAGGGRISFVDIQRLISQVCLAYHKRRLDECSGDVKEMVSSIQANHRDCLKLEQLLQLHTAKAVEEATAKYGELLSRARGDRLQEERLKQEALVKAKQQCEELRTRAEASGQWKNIATKLENALRCANNSFFGDSYSQEVIDKALEAFKKGPVDGEDGWKTRAEKAEKQLVSQQHSQEANKAWLKEFDTLKERAEKAEAEVIELQEELRKLRADR